MTRTLPLAAALLAGTALLPATAGAEQYFTRIASFPVNLNLQDLDQKTESSAEIIDATEDGMTLVYTDSPLGALGLIDITDPANPAPLGHVPLGGEPTAVAVKGGAAYVGINTSESYTDPSGHLAQIDLKSRAETGSCDLGGQPDSVAVARDGSFVAVAIENERDEDLNDGEIPQMPAGYVAIVPLRDGAMDCGGLIKADATGADVAGSDPEPEFVDVNGLGEIVVTLQENNHLLVLTRDGTQIASFSAGSMDLDKVDTEEERALTFDGTLADVPREPDAVKWLDDDRFVIANEGDYKGGSRGFSIFRKDGTLLYESGLAFEYEVALAGHYPEKRSGNKGVEPEGLGVGTFGDTTYIFVLSERGSVIGVYKDTGAAPEFVQLLPTGLGPEGAVTIPGRNLLAVSNEIDLIEDKGVRSHVTLYELGADAPSYPMIRSTLLEDGRPLGWGALSGLTITGDHLYAVNDSFYAMMPMIYQIDPRETPAQITAAMPVTRAGTPAQKLDMEGIAADGKGGFWIANEGRTGRLIPHALIHVDETGEIDEEIAFPAELLTVEKRFGAEGVARDGDTLWIAIQREWKDDPKGQVKLIAYNTDSEEWGAVRYPLEQAETGWVGLSEIQIHNGHAYVIERDNQIGATAKIKRIYRVSMNQMQPAKLGGNLPLVEKELVMDLIPVMQAEGGYVLDKIEGLAITADGLMFAVTDNDGVDDHNGETQFLRLGKVR